MQFAIVPRGRRPRRPGGSISGMRRRRRPACRARVCISVPIPK